ncbi:MAG TPA: hypothetical protein VN256_08130 [Pyrinomonadaceae bacterium]|nr:hypothetical protein [Pyrinomonadaceae bacterium]
MRNGLAQKVVAITPPGAIVDNAAFTTAVVDTRGFALVTIVVFLGALDIALAALKLRESNASDMTGAVDVDGGDYSVDSTLPAATDDNKMYAIHVNTKGRKRYLDLSLTGGDGTAGTYAVAFAILSDAEEAPSSAELRGFAAELSV